jgi:hypothetical protein
LLRLSELIEFQPVALTDHGRQGHFENIITEDRIEQYRPEDRVLKPGNSTAWRAIEIREPASDEHFAIRLQATE